MTQLAPSRRLLLLGGPALLAGCAAADAPVALDRQALATIRRVAVSPVAAPPPPVVQVTNPYSEKLGILGRIASESAGDTRSATVAALLAAQHLDPAAVLQAALAENLRTHGFTPAAQADATLAVAITQYGFVASGGGSDQPFRPTVTLAAQLVAANGTTLFRDTVPATGAAAFATFVDIENSPTAAAAGLRAALAAAAANVVKRLS